MTGAFADEAPRAEIIHIRALGGRTIEYVIRDGRVTVNHRQGKLSPAIVAQLRRLGAEYEANRRTRASLARDRRQRGFVSLDSLDFSPAVRLYRQHAPRATIESTIRAIVYHSRGLDVGEQRATVGVERATVGVERATVDWEGATRRLSGPCADDMESGQVEWNVDGGSEMSSSDLSSAAAADGCRVAMANYEYETSMAEFWHSRALETTVDFLECTANCDALQDIIVEIYTIQMEHRSEANFWRDEVEVCIVG